MNKKFISNISLFLLFNVIVKTVFVFFIDRKIQNEVGAAQYGTYTILLNIAFIFQIILDLGIDNFSRREIAQNPQLTQKYFSGIFILKLILAVCYMIVGLIYAMIKNLQQPDFSYLLLLFFNQFLACLVLYLRANLGGLHMFRTESVISVVDRFLLIIICGTLLYSGITSSEFHISWFIYSQTAAYGFTFLLTLVIVLRQFKNLRLHFNYVKYRSIIKQVYPYAILIFLMYAYMRIDPILLDELLPNGKIQAGIYAHSFRILDYLNNYAFLFPLLLLPIFSRMIKQKESVSDLLRISASILIVPSLVLLIACQFYSIELFHVLYTEHIEKSAEVFRILIISFLGTCITYTFGALLTANGNLKQLNIMASIALVINLSLNLVLIPRLEVTGAAITNVTTQVFTIFFHVILGIRIFKLRFNYYLIIKSLLVVIITITAGYLCSKHMNNWLHGFITTLAVGMLMSLTVIKPMEILKILLEKE